MLVLVNPIARQLSLDDASEDAFLIHGYDFRDRDGAMVDAIC